MRASIVYIFTRNKKEEGFSHLEIVGKSWPIAAQKMRTSFLGTDVTWNCPIRGGTKFTVIKTTMKHATSHESLIPAILWLNTTGKEEDLNFQSWMAVKLLYRYTLLQRWGCDSLHQPKIVQVRSSFLKKRQFTHRLTYHPQHLCHQFYIS